MTATVRQAVGSLLVVGLGGTELSGLERAWLKLVRPAGIILFRRNIADAPQTRALLADATALCTRHSLRCVDVEGGTVDRLRDVFAPLPSPQAVATMAAETGNPALIGLHGELIARSVKAFGFNTTLAPVLDLASPVSARVMGTRSAASTWEGVVEYARPFLAALAAHGIAGCGKHFPGLGGGVLDSHAETPAIRRGFNELWQNDLAPYRELRKQLPMIMVNHAAYPRTPSKANPATVSSFWINTVLRKRIGYRGIVFSDDMEMGGILKFMPIEEAAVTAIRAGMDLLEICHSPELILRAFESLLTEAEQSPAFRNLLLARSREVAKKRATLFTGRIPSALSTRQLESLRQQILRFRDEVGEPASVSSPQAIAPRATRAETA